MKEIPLNSRCYLDTALTQCPPPKNKNREEGKMHFDLLFQGVSVCCCGEDLTGQ